MTSTSAFSSLLSFFFQFTTSPSVLSFSLFPVFSFSSLSPNMASQGSSTRWCPTTEQVMILEEMYRAGIRNPNASQIQQITAHLSTFGKIEGKNVFYWFQNHKARDRQKLRRKLLRQQQQQQLQYHYSEQQLQPTIGTSSFSTPHQNPPSFLCQGCAEEAAQVMNFICKLDTLEMKDTEKSTMMYGHDWMVMMDVGSAPCYRPLETLELFPIKSTDIKEESNKTNHFQCPNSTN